MEEEAIQEEMKQAELLDAASFAQESVEVEVKSKCGLQLLAPSEAALCRSSLLSKWNTQLNENWPRAGQRGKLSLPMYSFEKKKKL